MWISCKPGQYRKSPPLSAEIHPASRLCWLISLLSFTGYLYLFLLSLWVSRPSECAMIQYVHMWARNRKKWIFWVITDLLKSATHDFSRTCKPVSEKSWDSFFWSQMLIDPKLSASLFQCPWPICEVLYRKKILDGIYFRTFLYNTLYPVFAWKV